MKKPIFIGSGVAIVTPFTDNGINFDKLEELIEYQIREGTDAIVICGTTGEVSTLPDNEHKEAIKFAVEKTRKRVPVIAGTGSNDTLHAIHLSKYAEDIGADAVLTVTPYYNKTSQKGLYEHFKLIAESIKIPVILYNVPSRTNLNIDVDTIKALSSIENIVAIKECNLNQVGDIVNTCGDDFTVYSGNDDSVVPLLSLGGKGVISVAANIIPRDFHDMVIKFINGDIEGSRFIQLNALELIRALFVDISPVPVKTAMNLMGMNVGKCRLPLIEMNEGNVNMLYNKMKIYGLIK